MKRAMMIFGVHAVALVFLHAAEPSGDREQLAAQHRDGAAKVADEQDELSADVQQLVIEQTVPQVIELLDQVENIMDEATERLAEADTGGATLAAQTEIIEKIHAASKEKQNQSGGGGKSGGAMMDMMERMMGKEPSGEGKKKGKGQGENGPAGEEGGKGQTGMSDTQNEVSGGASNGKQEARRVPKAAGNASAEIPEEFKKAFDAYNRGAEQKLK